MLICKEQSKLVRPCHHRYAVLPLPHLVLSRCRSYRKSNAFNARVNRSKLIGQPCLHELRTGNGRERKPFTCTKEKAVSYMACITEAGRGGNHKPTGNGIDADERS